MSLYRKITTVIKKQFVSGLLVVVPLIVTYIVLRFMFEAVDGLLSPLVHKLLGYDIPGLGLTVTILLVLLAGIITTNFLGARIYRYGDRFLVKTPLVRIIYTAVKQLLESLVAPKIRAFSEVALIEYPRAGIYAIGLLSAKTKLQNGVEKDNLRLVFIPSTPTPISGMVVLVPEDQIYRMDIPVEEAIKILVSGGIVAPPQIRIKHQSEINDEVENAPGESS